jgi:CheY-like chemotaxis protein
MRVLWVEDQIEDNQEVWRKLEAHNTTVAVASSVAEAFVKLDGESFEQIILDLRVPLGDSATVEHLRDIDYNGVYIVEYLERKNLLGFVPVCALTNFPTVANHYFAGKPVKVLQKATFLQEFEEIIYG